MDFIRFPWFSWDFIWFHEVSWISLISWDFGRVSGGLWQPVLPRSCPYRNLCSILAGCYLIDFHGFSWFSWISWDSRISWISGREGLPACGALWPRFLPRSCPYRNLCSILAGCYFIDFHDFHGFHGFSWGFMWFHEISLICMDFMRFHGFSWDFIWFQKIS